MNDEHKLNRVRLLFVVNEFDHVSYNQVILDLVKGLNKHKYDIHVGCIKDTEDRISDKLQRAGATVVTFGGDSHTVLRIIAKLVLYIKKHGIQIVHTHVLRSDLLGGIAARLALQPLLFSTKHNLGYVPGQKGWLLRSLCYWPLMYLPDQLISVTNVLTHRLISRPHFKNNRILTIHNGIDTEKYYRPEARSRFRIGLGISATDFVIGYTGRLVEGKGLDYLLQAGKNILKEKKCYFLIAGDGPLRASLECRAKELGVASNVFFLGFSRDIPEILAVMDLFVLPSLSEGLPLSLLEAMAAGKAVVATAVGGVTELIENKVTGLIVPPKNQVALTKTILWLLNDQRQRDKIGQCARKLVNQKFSVASMVNAHDNLYEAHLTNTRMV